MIVPQPRGKGLGRRELRGEILKFCAGVGRQSKEGREETPALPPRGRENSIIYLGVGVGQGRRDGFGCPAELKK